MSIFSKKEIDLYKGKNKVLKTVRVDKATAIKIDDLEERAKAWEELKDDKETKKDTVFTQLEL